MPVSAAVGLCALVCLMGLFLSLVVLLLALVAVAPLLVVKSLKAELKELIQKLLAGLMGAARSRKRWKPWERALYMLLAAMVVALALYATYLTCHEVLELARHVLDNAFGIIRAMVDIAATALVDGRSRVFFLGATLLWWWVSKRRRRFLNSPTFEPMWAPSLALPIPREVGFQRSRGPWYS